MIFRTLAYVFLLGSVSWADIPPAPSPGVSAPPELCLFRACMEKSGGSVMISPFSLYEVLRYMLPGAAGETEKQMAAVLPGDGKTRRDWTFLSGDFSRSLRCYSGIFLTLQNRRKPWPLPGPFSLNQSRLEHIRP